MASGWALLRPTPRTDLQTLHTPHLLSPFCARPWAHISTTGAQPASPQKLQEEGGT